MTPRPTHYAPTGKAPAWCGSSAAIGNHTRDRERVTCLRCRKSIAGDDRRRALLLGEAPR